MRKMLRTSLLVSAATLFIASSPSPVHAEEVSPDTIKALQDQINALQQQIAKIQTTQATQAAQAKTTATKTPAVTVSSANSPSPDADTTSGGVKVKVGGYIEMAGIDRTKNETTDVASNFNTAIPFNNSVNAHQSEFRGSARQSRITLLATGNADADTALGAYVESDFLGAAPTANSTESNSYNPRLRVIYATVDKTDWGTHFLAGQEWSLLTTNKVGISPRQENIPLTIDAQYVPGFNWTRNPQIRAVQDFDDGKIAWGVSLESPQASLGGITVPGTVNATNTGVSPLSTTASYSTDFAPDIISKLAFDPGFGHYEVFGTGRFFHDNVTSTFHNHDVFAGAGGAAAILPVVPKKVDVQLNVMAGQSIGRYGSVQLPDFAFTPSGGVKPIVGYTALVGVVGHPTPTWDAYVYAGEERVFRQSQSNTTYGYGDYGLSTAGCTTAVSGATCAAQTSNVWQITPGVWKRLYEGNYGKVQTGFQYSFTRRDAFTGAGAINPHALENTFMVSFRFYPM